MPVSIACNTRSLGRFSDPQFRFAVSVQRRARVNSQKLAGCETLPNMLAALRFYAHCCETFWWHGNSLRSTRDFLAAFARVARNHEQQQYQVESQIQASQAQAAA